MRKALASVVIIAFAGLLCTSLLAVFSGNAVNRLYKQNQPIHYPYFLAY